MSSSLKKLLFLNPHRIDAQLQTLPRIARNAQLGIVLLLQSNETHYVPVVASVSNEVSAL